MLCNAASLIFRLPLEPKTDIVPSFYSYTCWLAILRTPVCRKASRARSDRSACVDTLAWRLVKIGVYSIISRLPSVGLGLFDNSSFLVLCLSGIRFQVAKSGDTPNKQDLRGVDFETINATKRTKQHR